MFIRCVRRVHVAMKVIRFIKNNRVLRHLPVHYQSTQLFLLSLIRHLCHPPLSTPFEVNGMAETTSMINDMATLQLV